MFQESSFTEFNSYPNRLQILHFVYCLKPYQSSNSLNQSDGHQNLNFKCLD